MITEVCNPTLARKIHQLIVADGGSGLSQFLDAQQLATGWGAELRAARHFSDAEIMLAFSQFGYENVNNAMAVAEKHGRQAELTRKMQWTELGEALGCDPRTAQGKLEAAVVTRHSRQAVTVDIALVKNSDDAKSIRNYLREQPKREPRRPTGTKTAPNSNKSSKMATR